MKMEIRRDEIAIIPQDEEDIAYLEDVLGFDSEHPEGKIKRVNVSSTSSLAYIKIVPVKEK
jgi:hypothetical protein